MYIVVSVGQQIIIYDRNLYTGWQTRCRSVLYRDIWPVRVAAPATYDNV